MRPGRWRRELLRGAVASILLSADDAAQPATEATVRRAILRRRADLLSGPLSRAILHGETVVAPDIAADRAWTDHWAMVSAYRLLGCWSTPIILRLDAPVGVLSIFVRAGGEPSEDDLKLMQVIAHLAAIALQCERAELTDAGRLAAQ